jgi:hypothetical protein
MKRTIEGITLTYDPKKEIWSGEVDGEGWCFYRTSTGKWASYEKSHLTGGAWCATLGEAIEWVQRNRAEIEQKLLVRRAAGTRMVDPS